MLLTRFLAFNNMDYNLIAAYYNKKIFSAEEARWRFVDLNNLSKNYRLKNEKGVQVLFCNFFVIK